MPEERKDIDGKISSKRTMGMKYLNHALYMAWIQYIIGVGYALYTQGPIPFTTEVWYGIIFVGASLLGITLAERFRPLNK